MEGGQLRFKHAGGVTIPDFFSTKCFLSALRHEPEPGEIFIATYPKCGTTWMQNIVVNILRKGEPLDQPRDFFRASPFLDQFGSEDSRRLMIKPGVFKTHLAFQKVPWSTEAKYIYVARNPKDCCVSYYHHTRQIPGYRFTDGKFDVFFEHFITGNIEFDDYFDHLLSWYEHKEEPNVLFVTFEEMKRNSEDIVRRVAHFLGQEYVELLENTPGLLQKILENSSFDNMKGFVNEALSSLYDKACISSLLNDPNVPEGRKYIINYNASLPVCNSGKIEFIRKGDVGDWRHYFTEDHKNRFDRRIKEKTAGTDVMKLWDNIEEGK